MAHNSDSPSSSASSHSDSPQGDMDLPDAPSTIPALLQTAEERIIGTASDDEKECCPAQKLIEMAGSRISDRLPCEDHLGDVAGLCKKGHGIRARCVALRTLCERDEWRFDELVRACVRLLEDWHARSPLLTSDAPEYADDCEKKGLWEEAEVRHILDFLRGAPLTLLSSCAWMCYNNHVMSAVFDLMKLEPAIEVREAGWIPSSASAFLSELLDYSAGFEAQDHLNRTYPDDFKMAIGKFNFHQLGSLSISVVATDPIMLEQIWNRVHYGINDPDEEEERHKLAVRFLRYGLSTSDEELGRMLGMGWLSSARFFANLDSADDEDEAYVFEEVLEARPEFKQQFRTITATENPISHTAILGASIDEIEKDGRWYCMEEEADTI